MAFCPFCRVEHPATLTHCPDCGVRLVAELPLMESPAAPVEEVPVKRFRSQIEAEMWAEILEDAGIPTVLVPLGPGSGGFGISLWVPYELRVRLVDVERARALLPEGDG
jgi:hypothetical protein